MAGKIVTIDGYASHQQYLVQYAMQAPKGSRIVEMGCGYYSTPLLSEICRSRGLEFDIYYSDEPWKLQVESTIGYGNWHRVTNWGEWRLDGECFMVMLDNEELCVNRHKHIARLRDLCKFIVVHDADIYPKRGVPLVGRVPGKLFSHHTPHTFVVDCAGADPVDPTPPDKPSKAKPKPKPKKTKVPKLAYLPPSADGGPIRNGTPSPHVKTNGMQPAPTARPLSPSEMPKLNPPARRPDASKTAVVCCFTPGGDYDAHYQEYVGRLAEGVHNNTSFPVDFHCITIMDLQCVEGVRQIIPGRDNWKGWHIKAELFRPGLWKGYDRVLYLDLDTQITGNLDDITQSSERLVMLRDFYRPSIAETGMILWTPKDLEGLYDAFTRRMPKRTEKDATIIASHVKALGITPSFFQDRHRVGSYKVSLVDNSLEWQKFQVICYHGRPRPHEIGWDLDKKLLRTGPHGDRLVERKTKEYTRSTAVKPIWKGEDCFIIGGGPSLNGIDLDRLLEGQNVLGINDGYKFECCTVCFFGDTVWHGHHVKALAKWGKPIWTIAGVIDPNVKFLEQLNSGLRDDPREVAWNSNSGFAGLNLALHLGAKRIFLLGFDMDFGKRGESNWHPNIRAVNKNSYNCFLRHERDVQRDHNRLFPDRQIFNVTTPGYDSRLRIFPKVKLNQLVSDADLYVKGFQPNKAR